MRELNSAEIERTAGGNEPERRLPTVTVTGKKIDPYRFGVSLGQASNLSNPVIYTGFGPEPDSIGTESGGGYGVYDPSPDDGIFGLNIIEILGDGNIRFQIEVDGFYDLNGDGRMTSGEGPVRAGPPSVTTGGWDSFDTHMRAFQSFIPIPPPAVPGV